MHNYLHKQSILLWFVGVGVTCIVFASGFYLTRLSLDWYWEYQYIEQKNSLSQKYEKELNELEIQLNTYNGK